MKDPASAFCRYSLTAKGREAIGAPNALDRIWRAITRLVR
jgi:hypothetical protein